MNSDKKGGFMQSIQLPSGYGQEVYVDPDELYIKPEWINQELHYINFPDIPISQSNPVYEAYKEMFKYLFENGYKVVTDSSTVGNDAFFFTPCLDTHMNNTKEDYSFKKKNNIDYYLNSEGITEPFSISFPTDSFPETLPSLPFVLKNEESQGGIEKFIIRTPEQIDILKRFYNEINFYDRQKRIEKVKSQWSCYPDLEFDENGRSNKGISLNFVDYKKEFHQNMRIQKFIKTPTTYNTSLRVITSSSGDILASSLKYSKPSTNTKEKYYGLFDKYLSDPSSPYFLRSESIVSNTIAGGNSILLEKDNYSELEQEILRAHGINPNDAILPPDVMNACTKIASNCSREVGAICGLDFIYDDEEKTWKYLEEHEYPMLYSYAEKYNLPYNHNAKDFYTTNQLLDLRVRLHALALTMKKKQLFISENQKHR